MILIRIAGLAVLSGISAGGLVWFVWGTVQRLMAARATAPTDEDAPATAKSKSSSPD